MLIRRIRALFPALLLGLLLAACSNIIGPIRDYRAPPPVDGETPKIGRPYKINGVWYRPAYDPDYDETGYASWYGPQFHGRKTANGEIFDMNKLTAAHRTLPLPSYVKVTNLTNGRSLVLRVNDRGPFAKGRILDVSRRGAQLLGFERQGVARVRVQIVDADGTSLRRQDRAITAAAGATVPGMLYVQVGAFSSRRNAERLVSVLGDVGSVFVQRISRGSRTLYRVRVGPYESRRSAERALDRVHGAGYREARIFTEPVS